VRLPKEILVLLFLLLAMIVGVTWYVVDRRAKMRTPPPAPATSRP
jgi:hypothetical protein